MNKVKQAISEHKLLKIKDSEGRERICEPYCLHTGKKEILLHAYQRTGFSSSGEGQGWKNIPLLDIQYAVVLEEFVPRPEFNPEKLRGIL